MKMMIEHEDCIQGVSPWIPLASFPSNRTFASLEMQEKYGRHGVYQIAEKKFLSEITNYLVHEKIGYTGRSTNMPGRVYQCKAAATGGATARHGAGRYIRQNGIDVDDVFVRLISTNEQGQENQLENKIHTQCLALFEQRYAWRSASAGDDGFLSELEDRITNIDDIDTLTTMYNMMDERAKELLYEDYKKSLRN